jgi:hypothetical protein
MEKIILRPEVLNTPEKQPYPISTCNIIPNTTMFDNPSPTDPCYIKENNRLIEPLILCKSDGRVTTKKCFYIVDEWVQEHIDKLEQENIMLDSVCENNRDLIRIIKEYNKLSWIQRIFTKVRLPNE